MKFDSKAFSEALQSFLELWEDETPETLAQSTGMKPLTVTHLAQGMEKNPRINDVLKLLDYVYAEYDLSLADFLCDDEEQGS